MTEQDIVRLAEEADLWLHSDRKYEAVEKFAVLVAAAEREACAKVCDEISSEARKEWKSTYNTYHDGRCDGAFECQTYIRARGQHD